MADRYEFANIVDDIFKSCRTIGDMCKVYIQPKKRFERTISAERSS